MQPPLSLLHEFFEAAADARPGSVAVSFRGTDITYAQLEKRANQIARWLRSKGVSRGSVVAILLARSPDAYACILGILKAGAAYVPVDPEYPGSRIAYIISDSKAKCLVTTSALAPAGYRGKVLRLDSDGSEVDSQAGDRLPAEIVGSSPEDLCYLIYTSGSTGRPKGVAVEHRNAAHLVEAEGAIYGVEPADRVCQAASLSFDLSVEEVWMAFRSGATLVACPSELSHGGPDFQRFLAEYGVTVLSTVPTLLSTFEEDVESLRLLILGGETCPDWLVERWWRPGRRVVNTYGPTETTVIATYADLEPGRKVTIGHPVPGYAVYLLDESLHPVPNGKVGEICIGGEGVARGYVNLPEETAERFVPDPFDGGFGARMYRSGDLGRRNRAGTIDFLGRADAQVKLRGFRIELSEVESALMKQKGVKAAACSVQDLGGGTEILVGYVVPKAGHKFDERSFRSAIRKVLPGYMIPSVIETVRFLPRLPSGKLDRASLPVPLLRENRRGAEEAPANETERRLADVWTSHFRPQAVGVNDHFFNDLGGHSLLAARTVSDLRKDPAFSGISVADVYEHPTIRLLASRFSEGPTRDQTDALPAVPARRHLGPHLSRGMALLQGLALYFPFGFSAFEWVTPYLVLFLLYAGGFPFLYAAGWALVSAVLVFPVLLALAIGAKWVVLGRVRPGRHRLWGGYYLRWWFVHSLVATLPLDYLEGTPLLPGVYRLFGAKIGRDVHLETNKLRAFDLISIGDGTSIDEDASLLGYSVEGGELIIGPVTVGRRCFVGTASVLQEWSVVEDGGRLEDLSLLPRGGKVPKGETWAGSPARLSSVPSRPMPIPPEFGRLRRLATPMAYSLLALSMPLIVMAAILPGVMLLYSISLPAEPLLYLLSIPLVGASFVVLVMTEFVVIKKVFLGRVNPGVYRVHSGFYIRYWTVDLLHRLTLDLVGAIHATIYIGPWYRALGSRIGRSVELSTATSTVPDLLELDDGATVADEVSLGSPHTENGWTTLAPTVFGRRAFAGNSAVIPAGTVLGEDTLCGVLTVPPSDPTEGSKKGAAWLGSPPIELPRRQASPHFPDASTYEPTRRKRLIRGSIEALRVTVPAAGFIAVTSFVLEATILLWGALGAWPAFLLIPVSYAAACGALAMLAVAAKWFIIGRYRPFEKPLYTTFIWRLEFINGIYEFLVSPLALEPLQGTPLLPAYQRLMGAKVGRDVYLHTTGFLEWDLVEVGDWASLNEDCVLQTHLFEDRVLKASYLRVGSCCDVGAFSIVLYESEMEDGSRLDALSLLMKGERLPSRTAWSGIPARERIDEVEVVETEV